MAWGPCAQDVKRVRVTRPASRVTADPTSVERDPEHGDDRVRDLLRRLGAAVHEVREAQEAQRTGHQEPERGQRRDRCGRPVPRALDQRGERGDDECPEEPGEGAAASDRGAGPRRRRAARAAPRGATRAGTTRRASAPARRRGSPPTEPTTRGGRPAAPRRAAPDGGPGDDAEHEEQELRDPVDEPARPATIWLLVSSIAATVRADPGRNETSGGRERSAGRRPAAGAPRPRRGA